MNERDQLLYECLRIRMVEEKIIELYPSDLIQSPVHLSIGQEAVAVGVCKNLLDKDQLFINYRGHAFYLAKGGPMAEFFAELMGKVTGLSKGKAGSMHLAAPEKGVMGSSAVVASTISHAVGSALASNIKGEKEKICVSVFGDGAMEQGVFYESLNFAALHETPVLFLCEDTGLAIHTHLNERQAFDIWGLISAFEIPLYSVSEGYDPEIVSKHSEKAIEFVRQQRKPAFLKIKTARYREHVGPGEDFESGYRSLTEIAQWKGKDPLLEPKEIFDEFRSKISKEIDDALEFAINSPSPTIKDLLTDVL